MKKIWSKTLFFSLIIGLVFLSWAAFFDSAASYTRYFAEAPLAYFIGLGITGLVIWIAKKTGVGKELEEEADKFVKARLLENKLTNSKYLNCIKCERTFLQEDLQGYVCPNCRSALLPAENEQKPF